MTLSKSLLSKSSSINGTLSIDRITLLFFTPSLSLWNDGKDNSLMVKLMSSLVEKVLKKDLDPDFPQASQTDLYLYHYRTVSGFDIQFGTKMPKRKKITDEHYILSFGTAEDKERGFLWQKLANEYAFRVEFNPNKSESFTFLSPLFSQFTGKAHLSNIRVGRVDVAIDYPADINPSMVLCDRCRKSFTATGTTGLETVYFGTRSSENYFRLYNKAQEMKEKDGIELDHPLWRLELECKRGFLLTETPDYSKVFERFHFYKPSVRSGDWLIDLINQQAAINGLQSVLRTMPKNTQIRYREKFKELSLQSVEDPSFICQRDFADKFNMIRTSIAYTLGYNFFDGANYGRTNN